MTFEKNFSVNRFSCTKSFAGFNFSLSKNLDLSSVTIFVNIKNFMNLWKFPDNLKRCEHKILSYNIWSYFFLNYSTNFAQMSNIYFIFAKGYQKRVLLFYEWALKRKCHEKEMVYFLWNGPKVAQFSKTWIRGNMYF